jgi:hypothetical protein
MKDYKTWKKEYIAGDISRKYISENDLKKAYHDAVVLPTEEKERQREQKQENEAKQKVEQLAGDKLKRLTEKITSSGFNSISSEELSILSYIFDSTLSGEVIPKEQFDLVKATLSDEQAYRFFSLRTSSRTSFQLQAMLEAMNVNLSDISKKTGGVEMASMFTGMFAARQLGDEIADDMGGGDDSVGGWEE